VFAFVVCYSEEIVESILFLIKSLIVIIVELFILVFYLLIFLIKPGLVILEY